jgi:uncharacterized protein YndB with AHSA1/START domain
MAVVEQSVLINRPIEDVFNFVAGFENYPEWNHNMLECKRISDGSTSIGSIFDSRMVYMGNKYSAPLEIKEYEPNKKITFYTSKFGFFKWFKGTFSFDKVNGVTQGTITAETDLVSPFKPMLIIMPILGKRSWGKHLGELKRILESDA